MQFFLQNRRSHSFSATLLGAALAIAQLGAVPTVQAQSVSPEVAQTVLQQALCLNDWNQAIYAVNLLIGSPSSSPAMREQWVAYRRQLQAHQTQRSTFDMSNTLECTAALARARQVAQPTAADRPLDWDRATAGFRQSPGAVQSRPQAAASARQNSQGSGSGCGDLMNARSGDRRVSTGSVSSRWNYAIFQNSGGYFVRHWEQADCTRQGETLQYSTEREAYRAFICRHDQERCERLRDN